MFWPRLEVRQVRRGSSDSTTQAAIAGRGWEECDAKGPPEEHPARVNRVNTCREIDAFTVSSFRPEVMRPVIGDCENVRVHSPKANPGSRAQYRVSWGARVHGSRWWTTPQSRSLCQAMTSRQLKRSAKLNCPRTSRHLQPLVTWAEGDQNLQAAMQALTQRTVGQLQLVGWVIQMDWRPVQLAQDCAQVGATISTQIHLVAVW